MIVVSNNASTEDNRKSIRCRTFRFVCERLRRLPSGDLDESFCHRANEESGSIYIFIIYVCI